MDIFDGRISSCAFQSGDRIVIGDWERSPLGAFTNIMWAQPDGTRVLLSPSQQHADYVSELYNFEETRVVPITVKRTKRSVSVSTNEFKIHLAWGRGISLPIPRPKWFISTVEYLFARLLFGTRTFGHTRNGRKEWYCVKGLAWIKTADAEYNGKSLEKMGPFCTESCFGFSDPPKRPSSVRVKSMIAK
jgi:hypothetical protein